MTVLVFVDHADGSPKKVSNQILTAASKLGAGEVHALLVGEGASTAAEKVGAYGASRAFVWDAAEADQYATEAHTAAVVAAAEASGATVLLYPADPFLSDAVARAAVRLGAGVISDVTDLALDGDRVVATKAIFGGDMTSRCQVRGERLQVIGVKANAFVAEESGGGSAEVVALDVTLEEKSKRARVVDVVEQEAGGRPEMTEAAIVVAGGRGLGDAEAFQLVEQLGQTGKTVSPQLYLGCGISGAIQHRAGMQTSQTIAVINKDGEAPIFSIADFGVVGDLHKVIPPLIEEIKARKE